MKSIWFPITNYNTAGQEAAKQQLYAAAKAELEDAEEFGGLEQLCTVEFPFEMSECIAYEDGSTEACEEEEDATSPQDEEERRLQEHRMKQLSSWTDRHGY